MKLNSIKNYQEVAAREIAHLRKTWDQLEPPQIAEELIRLRKYLPIHSPLQKELDELEFDFVFPVNIDLRGFVKTVDGLARKVLGTGTPASFRILNEKQKEEVYRELKEGQ